MKEITDVCETLKLLISTAMIYTNDAFKPHTFRHVFTLNKIDVLEIYTERNHEHNLSFNLFDPKRPESQKYEFFETVKITTYTLSLTDYYLKYDYEIRTKIIKVLDHIYKHFKNDLDFIDDKLNEYVIEMNLGIIDNI